MRAGGRTHGEGRAVLAGQCAAREGLRSGRAADRDVPAVVRLAVMVDDGRAGSGVCRLQDRRGARVSREGGAAARARDFGRAPERRAFRALSAVCGFIACLAAACPASAGFGFAPAPADRPSLVLAEPDPTSLAQVAARLVPSGLELRWDRRVHAAGRVSGVFGDWRTCCSSQALLGSGMATSCTSGRLAFRREKWSWRPCMTALRTGM